MVYGPVRRIWSKPSPRKSATALSLPYHIGNGVFGGLLPVVGLAVVADRQHLRRPAIDGVALVTWIVGTLLLKRTAC